MADYEVLFINHFHTPESNRNFDEITERRYLGLPGVKNHFMDPFDLTERLPCNAIYGRTEHFLTRGREDPRSFYQVEVAEAEEDGWEIEYHDTHITGVKDDNRLAIIHGNESSLEHQNTHLTQLGRDIDETIVSYEDSREEMIEHGREAEILSAAHPYFEFGGIDFGVPEDDILDFLDRGMREDDFEFGLNYTTGYDWALGNRIARGQKFGESRVEELAREKEATLHPTLDSHTVLPKEMAGAGIVDETALQELEEGDFPTDKLNDADVATRTGKRNSFRRTGLEPWEMLYTQPHQLPMREHLDPIYSSALSIAEGPGLPSTPEDHKDVAEHYARSVTEDLEYEDIFDGRVAPN